MTRFNAEARAGFTLIELLVVVAIVGVMAAATVPAVSSARDRGLSAAVQAEVATYESAAAVVLAASGNFPVPDQDDIEDSCLEYDGAPGAYTNPRFCCVADRPCTYAGRTLAPLSRGPFAANAGGRPGVLGGALPRLPRLPAKPVAAGQLQYQGVFHSCNDAACQRPNVTWTQPSACPSGTTRNGVTGLCQREIDRTPVTVREQTETYCYDGQDNDEDEATDCADPDCAGRARCGAENTDVRCSDEFDNDGDGDSDCNDSDCAMAEGCNDVQFESDCADSADNDYDELIDCADPDCEGQIGPDGEDCEPFGEQSCVDTYDNDNDSFIDCADSDCASAPACRAACVPVSPNESDCTLISGDEDCDGAANCADSDCAYLWYCGGSEVGLCNDGLDNDMDGSYDCYPGDSDCVGGPEC
jgi:prepilin-type N-terminal cleavage/methylation domain-containing protein